MSVKYSEMSNSELLRYFTKYSELKVNDPTNDSHGRIYKGIHKEIVKREQALITKMNQSLIEHEKQVQYQENLDIVLDNMEL